jgi:hypothetical protein
LSIQGLSEISLHQQVYFFLPNKVKTGTALSIPNVVFLTGFDPMLIGYADKSFILPQEYLRRVITLTGILKPSVLIDGKISGIWSIRRGCMLVELFAPLSKSMRERIRDYVSATFASLVSDVTFLDG